MGGGKGESTGIAPEPGPLLAQRNLGPRPVCMGQRPADQPFTDQLSLEVCIAGTAHPLTGKPREPQEGRQPGDYWRVT